MPKSVEIKATATKLEGKPSAVIYVDFGETAEESIQLFGSEVVNSNFVGSARITAQAAIRRMLEAGKTPEEITVKMKEWKPGVALERVTDPIAAATAKYMTMDVEEQQAFIKKLKQAAKK